MTVSVGLENSTLCGKALMARPAGAPAGTARRLGAPDAKNRTVLLDAAEQLMRDEGYAAVTSRRVAEQAGLKPQLVHYYFRTMDDLFLEMFRRGADRIQHFHQLALRSPQPLWALWELNTDAAGTATDHGVHRAGQPPQDAARPRSPGTPNFSAPNRSRH